MIQGVYTALVTPFNTDYSLDIGAYRTLLEFQILHGIDGLVPIGTTGESPTLLQEEKDILISHAVVMAAKKIPVIVGSGSNCTSTAIAQTKRAFDLGADMTLQVAPYYNKPSENGLYRHFAEIAEQGGLPVIVYNVPGRSAVNMSVSLICKLAQHPMIVGIKEASGNMTQMMDIMSLRNSDFSILSGDDALTLPCMALGGDGVISVASNMFPKEMKELTQALLAGNLSTARGIHQRLYPFFCNQFIETNPVPIKTYMAHLGMMGETVRAPLCELTPSNREKLLATKM